MADMLHELVQEQALQVQQHQAQVQQPTATRCNTRRTLQHTAKGLICSANSCRSALKKCNDSNTLQHTATHCNTLQHTATHCNTLQEGWSAAQTRAGAGSGSAATSSASATTAITSATMSARARQDRDTGAEGRGIVQRKLCAGRREWELSETFGARASAGVL